MKRCWMMQLAFLAIAITTLLAGSESCLADSGSWGGGFGSRGMTGGSWGSHGGFRTPVRDFFAYRQPVRSLVRGVGRFTFNRGWGSRGWGGSSGYGSTGFGSRGYHANAFGWNGGSVGSSSFGGGSTGYSYYSSGASAVNCNTCSSNLMSAPSAYIAPSNISMTGCSDCIGALGYASPIPNGTLTDSNGFGDGTIISTDQSVIPAEQYYEQGSDSIPTESSEGSSLRGFENPPTPEPESGDATTSIQRGEAILHVNVPLEAKVYVNGRLTRTKGELRKYVSRKLARGQKYDFDVKAVIEREGREIALEERVALLAGRDSHVNFDFERPVLTQLTLKVPQNAKVELCGNQTKATGNVRHFKTRLEPGKVWNDYKISVSYDVDGETVNQNRTISIKAGKSYVVDFDGENDMYVSK